MQSFLDVGPPDGDGIDLCGKDVALFSGVTYPNATDYKTVDPGVASIDVRNMGTTTVALTSSPIDLQAGDSTSIFAIGASSAVRVPSRCECSWLSTTPSARACAS